MTCFNVYEPREVSRVEGQDALHAVDMHRSGEAGVVYLDTGDAMGNEESSPLNVNLRVIR
jgi:hypothetical protein